MDLKAFDTDFGANADEFNLVASSSNTPPVANPDSVTTAENIAINIPVATLRANDSDAGRRQEVETIFI